MYAYVICDMHIVQYVRTGSILYLEKSWAATLNINFHTFFHYSYIIVLLEMNDEDAMDMLQINLGYGALNSEYKHSISCYS